MEPRIAFRTHYQIDEPAYMKFVVKRCTSPVQSAYREVVAQKLSREIKRRGTSLNEDAAAYAVDLAKDLGLITDNHNWTDAGHLLNLITHLGNGNIEDELPLSLPEKMLHFRVFLEHDGAALVFLARRLIRERSFVASGNTWNALATDMFVDVFTDYLAITTSTEKRVGLRRQIERIKAREYRGHSGEHKIFVHLQTLYRLGLVLRPAGARTYALPDASPGSQCGLMTLAEVVPDVMSLEQVLRNHEWVKLAAQVFQIQTKPWTDILEFAFLASPFYQRVMATGTPLCHISTLIEALQIQLLSHDARLLSWEVAMEAMERFQKRFPKDVRFHVDRRGQPAFVKLSSSLLRSYS